MSSINPQRETAEKAISLMAQKLACHRPGTIEARHSKVILAFCSTVAREIADLRDEGLSEDKIFDALENGLVNAMISTCGTLAKGPRNELAIDLFSRVLSSALLRGHAVLGEGAPDTPNSVQAVAPRAGRA